MPERFLHFEPIIYPLWRRRYPFWLQPLASLLSHRIYPADADKHPPQTPSDMAAYLRRWDILGGESTPFIDIETLQRGLTHNTARIRYFSQLQPPTPDAFAPLRIPAQWEMTEKILISWGILYPPLWPMHAQMAEAISPVAEVEIVVPTEMWARAIWLYLTWREKANLDNIVFFIARTDDIWIRDYGPIVGKTLDGRSVVLDAIYDPLPAYPQADDDLFPARWAAEQELPLLPLPLHTEGGNLWSDGVGTLIMSEQIFYSNPYYDRPMLEKFLRRYIQYDKLIITPRLPQEETGHVDMLVKLGAPNLVFLSSPQNAGLAAEALRATKRLFQRETNAAGQRYEIVELPTPPLYFNWFVYNIRRSYTNALTVNGRVLVPIYGYDQDNSALDIYAQALPNYEIIPIDSAVGINGGGAVHCMTKEIPR